MCIKVPEGAVTTTGSVTSQTKRAGTSSLPTTFPPLQEHSIGDTVSRGGGNMEKSSQEYGEQANEKGSEMNEAEKVLDLRGAHQP